MANANRILVGVNGPGPQYPAIDWALAYAPSVHAEVELVHVVDLSWRSNPAPFAEAALLEAERRLRDIAERHAGRAVQPIHSTVLMGRAVPMLVEYAAQSKMIVLGVKRPRTLREAVFNTAGARIAARASVSTVVVPHATAPGHGIVVGVDDSEFSAAPLAFAAREADRLDVPLTVVHSWHAPQPWVEADVVDWPVAPEDEERRILSEAIAGLAQQYPDLQVHSKVVFARAAEALFDAARGASLLVVGSHGRHGFEKAWLGSTSEELVLAPPTAVAVIR